MAWENREGGVGHYSDVPNYTGTAYGMNRPGNWESGWSPTSQMSERPYQPKRDSEFHRYNDRMVNMAPHYWQKGGGPDWMSERGNLGGSNYRNIELANRGIGSLPDEDEGMSMAGHAKQFLGGFKPPSFMMADSIVKNQAQHKDLDQYFQSRDPENWRNAKNARFFENQGFDTGDLTRQGGQARGYFNRAGITDQVLSKFMDKSYKFGGNEAWLRSQAEDKDQFDQGMSFIKNAVDTSELHESVFGTRDMRDYDEHYDIAPDAGFAPGQGYEGNEYDLENQIKLLENQTIPDEIFEGTTEDITGDITFGGNERFEEQLAAEQPLPWEAQRQKAIFRNRPQGVRGMLGYGMEFDRMAYPYGEDFQDSLDEFWDINPRDRGRMVPYS